MPATETRQLRVALELNATTMPGQKVLAAILNALRTPTTNNTRLTFFALWLTRNNYRLVKREHFLMVELELALLFDALFEALGVDPYNFPMMELVSLCDV